MVKVDLHVHTRYSSCSRFRLGELLYLAEQTQVPIIAVTDHEVVEAVPDLRRRRPELPLLPGIEIRTQEGDFLVYALDEKRLAPLGRGFSSILEFTPDPELALVWAHPLTRGFGDEQSPLAQEENLRRIMEKIDAVETINGNILTRIAVGHEPREYLEFISGLARKYGRGLVGGSDCHYFYSFMKCWTEMPDDIETPEDVLLAVKTGRTQPAYEPSYFERLTRVVKHSRPALGLEGR